jgi:hypothetical protein
LGKPCFGELSSLTVVFKEGIGGNILVDNTSNRAEAAADASCKNRHSLLPPWVEKAFALINI